MPDTVCDSVLMPHQRFLFTSEGKTEGAFNAVEWGLLAFVGITWGASFLLIAEGLESFSPGAVSFLRIAFGLAALSLIPAARTRVDRQDWPRLAGLGVLWMAVPFTMFAIAEQSVSSSLSGILNGGTSIGTAVVASLLLGRLPGRIQRVGLLVGLVGLLLVGWPTAGEGGSSAWAVGLIVISIASYALATNLVVPLQQKYGAIPVLWRAQMIAVVAAVPYAVVGISENTVAAKPLLALIALGVGGTALAYVAMTNLAGRVGASRASVVSYVMVPVAMILGVLVRNEELTVLTAFGAAVVLAGAWLISRKEHRESANGRGCPCSAWRPSTR